MIIHLLCAVLAQFLVFRCEVIDLTYMLQQRQDIFSMTAIDVAI